VLHFRKPPRLRPGSTIGVAALSGPVDPAKLASGVRSIEARGYRVVTAANLSSTAMGFLAGSDAERAEGYRGLLADPSIDAIFFARGGYGSSRLLERLDTDEIATRPRIHLGASDLTAFFAWLARRTGLGSFYGPMVAVEIGSGVPLDWESVLAGVIPAAHAFSEGDALASGTGEGPLVGGCLSLLASLAGTPEAVSGRGAVLFWEDVGEAVYRLDRMLTQLDRSGTFEDLRGMVIGSVVPGRGESAETVREYLRDRFAGSAFPVAMNLHAGHLPAPRTLPLGAAVRLDVRRGGGLLEFLEAGVS
jgi:muramoyltetrapeptide carboxypeptidase